jgi:hypothetical protein
MRKSEPIRKGDLRKNHHFFGSSGEFKRGIKAQRRMLAVIFGYSLVLFIGDNLRIGDPWLLVWC